MPANAPKRSFTPTEFVGIDRKPNSREKSVRIIPINATRPRPNRIGLMGKPLKGGAEERTICMKDVTAPYNRGQAGADGHNAIPFLASSWTGCYQNV